MTRTLRTLMSGLIDYAGLFPPSRLDMAPAVERYAGYLRAEHAEMLGRFICPASRLDELTEHGAVLMPGTFATSGYREHAGQTDPWTVSVVIDTDLGEAVRRIDAFNDRHAEEAAGLARADTIELRVESPADIDDLLDDVPADLMPHFEFPASGDPRGFVAALAGNDAAAKIRCGGVTPDAFPDAGHIAAFLHACAAADVPFKATAGLHHPLRSEHPLTYEPDSPRGVMHGFLNLFLAAALVRARRLKPDRTTEMLLETDPGAFTFTDDGAGWRDHTVDLITLSRVRETFALGYGSCSFDEPIDDLRELGLL